MKERIRRLYRNGLEGKTPSITAEGVANAVAKHLITQAEADEILQENVNE